jgi:nitroimidazol reductase NimA-like FMN-containing flavoprotein (pyridoxamine 5'-phosphate oxidase superfamily)
MTAKTPTTDIDPRFSSPDATATPWAEGDNLLEQAEIYWLSTVRPDGRPHVTPLAAVWQDGAIYFVTGPDERKALNLAQNPHVVITTGCNKIAEGLDVVIEGEAVRVTDHAKLQPLADRWPSKYSGFEFEVRDGAFYSEEGGTAYVFEVTLKKALGFGKGEQFSQTRWTF